MLWTSDEKKELVDSNTDCGHYLGIMVVSFSFVSRRFEPKG